MKYVDNLKKPANTCLMHPPRPRPFGPRKAEPDLQATHRLARNHDPVQLAKLLGRQRRAETRIVVLEQPPDPSP